MPLEKGRREKVRSHNIAKLINEGYPAKQAEAIAYKESGEDAESHRSIDVNGYIEIKDNPISKAGVFEYSGRQISPELDADKIYNVYRPAEELADPATLASFRLIPIVDDHAMLGAEDDGLLPAERKGVHGVVGEEIYFDESDGKLKANLRIFSEKLSDLINSGKKDLSIGYRCVYDIRPGVHEGQPYDVIQRQLRGNHLALVIEGRSGPDVAVLDHFKFTFDARELSMVDQPATHPMSTDADMSSVMQRLDKLEQIIFKIVGAEQKEASMMEGDNAYGDPADKPVLDAEIEDPAGKSEEKDQTKKIETGEDEEGEKKISAMDSAIRKMARDFDSFKKNAFKEFSTHINKRNDLANRLSHTQVGVFDHKDMTLDEVAQYGVKKLGLNCEAGQEHAVLSGFLAAKTAAPSNIRMAAMDGFSKSPEQQAMDAYFNQGAK